MGKCLSKQTRNVILVMVGLDNAGKTTTAKGLVGESPADVAPTLGFSSFHLKHQNFNVTIYDVGGNKSIRGIWRNYLAEAFGFIFVVDASNTARVEECKEVLHSLLKNPVVSGKPFLILANKQDVENALDEVEVSNLLHIEPIVNEVKSRTRVETCSAVSVSSKKQDRGIQMGFRWLLATIGVDFANLQLKVEQDVIIQREIEAKEKLEREERIKKLREERGENNEQIQDVHDDHFTKEDPFRPVNIVVKAIREKESQSETNNVNSVVHISSFKQPEIIEMQAPSVNSNVIDRKQSSGSSKSACELIRDAPLNENKSEKPSHRSSEFSNESTAPPGLVNVHNENDIGKPPISRQSTIDDGDDLYTCTSTSSSNQSPHKNQRIELEKMGKSRKKKLFARNNKTAPKQEAFLGELPPLVIRSEIRSDNAVPWIKMTPTSLSSAQMDTFESDSDVNVNWNLAEDLEVR